MKLFTHSKRLLDLEYPKPGDFFLGDIAHGLANMCRWGGQCPRFYSVAQHSIYVSFLVPEEHALSALMHDASEAFLCDVPKLVKRRMPIYQLTEHRVMMAIAQQFEFEYPKNALVEQADRAALWAESQTWWPGHTLPGVEFVPPPVPAACDIRDMMAHPVNSNTSPELWFLQRFEDILLRRSGA